MLLFSLVPATGEAFNVCRVYRFYNTMMCLLRQNILTSLVAGTSEKNNVLIFSLVPATSEACNPCFHIYMLLQL